MSSHDSCRCRDCNRNRSRNRNCNRNRKSNARHEGTLLLMFDPAKQQFTNIGPRGPCARSLSCLDGARATLRIQKRPRSLRRPSSFGARVRARAPSPTSVRDTRLAVSRGCDTTRVTRVRQEELTERSAMLRPKLEALKEAPGVGRRRRASCGSGSGLAPREHRQNRGQPCRGTGSAATSWVTTSP